MTSSASAPILVLPFGRVSIPSVQHSTSVPNTAKERNRIKQALARAHPKGDHSPPNSQAFRSFKHLQDEAAQYAHKIGASRPASLGQEKTGVEKKVAYVQALASLKQQGNELQNYKECLLKDYQISQKVSPAHTMPWQQLELGVGLNRFPQLRSVLQMIKNRSKKFNTFIQLYKAILDEFPMGKGPQHYTNINRRWVKIHRDIRNLLKEEEEKLREISQENFLQLVISQLQNCEKISPEYKSWIIHFIIKFFVNIILENKKEDAEKMIEEKLENLFDEIEQKRMAFLSIDEENQETYKILFQKVYPSEQNQTDKDTNLDLTKLSSFNQKLFGLFLQYSEKDIVDDENLPVPSNFLDWLIRYFKTKNTKLKEKHQDLKNFIDANSQAQDLFSEIESILEKKKEKFVNYQDHCARLIRTLSKSLDNKAVIDKTPFMKSQPLLHNLEILIVHILDSWQTLLKDIPSLNPNTNLIEEYQDIVAILKEIVKAKASSDEKSNWKEKVRNALFKIEVFQEQGSMAKNYKISRTVLRKKNKDDPEHEEVVEEFLVKELHTPQPLETWLFNNYGEHTASVKHPNLIHTIGAFLSKQGVEAIVIKFVNGQSYFNARNQLSFYQRMLCQLQVIAAVDALHQAKRLHQDLKPANVLVTIIPDLHVHLVDMGFQTVLSTIVNLTDCYKGTYGYLAPEICRDTPHSYLSDIFSLGAMLYEECTGKLPFAWGKEYVWRQVNIFNPEEIVEQAMQTARNTVQDPLVKEKLLPLIEQMLSYQPDRRPNIQKVKQSFTTFVDALSLDDELSHLRTNIKQKIEDATKQQTHLGCTYPSPHNNLAVEPLRFLNMSSGGNPDSLGSLSQPSPSFLGLLDIFN